MPVTKHLSCGEDRRTPRVCAAFELVDGDAAFVELDDLRRSPPPDFESRLYFSPLGRFLGRNMLLTRPHIRYVRVPG
jgi:hypothetical protein